MLYLILFSFTSFATRYNMKFLTILFDFNRHYSELVENINEMFACYCTSTNNSTRISTSTRTSTCT